MLTVQKPGKSELIIKKSHFIGYCSHAASEQEARAAIAAIRREHSKANHNCYAYSIEGAVYVDGTTGAHATRTSDNGEPRGTAGLPILAVFQKAGLANWVCVVTRYFGGIMLGAGGLVRAYGSCAKMAMEDAGIVQIVERVRYSLVCEYAQYDRIAYNLGKLPAVVVSVDFGVKCTLHVEIDAAQKLQFADIFGQYILEKPAI